MAKLSTYAVTSATAAQVQRLGAVGIIKGSMDASLYPGVTLGALPGSTERTANGTALQAFLNAAASAGKYAEFPPGTYQYIATTVQNSINTGLQVPYNLPGAVGVGPETLLQQFAVNYPAFTVGDFAAGSNAFYGLLKGFRIGFGVSQTGQTNAHGLLFGRTGYCDIDRITVAKDAGLGAFPGYTGIQIGKNTSTFFFQNKIGTITCSGAQVSFLQAIANGTGNTWNNIYFGGGGVGNRNVLSGPAFDIQGFFNAEWGTIRQLNIEWTDTGAQALIANTSKSLLIDQTHFEGIKVSGASPILFFNNNSYMDIRCLSFLNLWIAAANFTGTATMFYHYLDAMSKVGTLQMQWDGGSEAVCSTGYRIYDENATVVGRKPSLNIGSTRFTGGGLTGAITIDANTPNAAPGAAGAVTGWESYRFDKNRSRTLGAKVFMGNADMTFYGQHESAVITMGTTLTALRNLTLSDKVAASGAGASILRNPGDIVEVFRSAAGAFDLLVKNQGGTTIYTFSGAGSANTAKSFEWSGSAWTAI